MPSGRPRPPASTTAGPAPQPADAGAGADTLEGVLYVAREDEPDRHHGVVVRVEASAFAPSALLLRDHANGVIDGPGFARRYIWELRQLWNTDRRAFLDVIELATGGTACTITDAYGDAAHAPRRILAAALKQIAKTQRDEARRRERAGRARGEAAPV